MIISKFLWYWGKLEIPYKHSGRLDAVWLFKIYSSLPNKCQSWGSMSTGVSWILCGPSAVPHYLWTRTFIGGFSWIWALLMRKRFHPVHQEGFLKRQAQPESWVLRGGPWPSVVVPAATKRSLADPHTDMTAPWTSRLFMFSKTPVLFRPARSLEIRPQHIPTSLHRIMGSEDSPIVSYKVAQGIHWVHAHKCNAKPSKQISNFLRHRKNLNALQWCRRFSTVNWHSADSQALTTH